MSATAITNTGASPSVVDPGDAGGPKAQETPKEAKGPRQQRGAEVREGQIAQAPRTQTVRVRRNQRANVKSLLDRPANEVMADAKKIIAAAAAGEELISGDRSHKDLQQTTLKAQEAAAKVKADAAKVDIATPYEQVKAEFAKIQAAQASATMGSPDQSKASGLRRFIQNTFKIDMGIQPTMGEVLESGYKLSMEHFLTMCSRYEALKGELERMYGVTREQCDRGQAAAKDLKTTRVRVAKLDGLRHELEGQLQKLDASSPEAMEIRANIAELRQQLFELARQQKFFTFAVDSINNSIEKYQNFEETLNNLLYNMDDLLAVSSEKLTEIGEVVQTVAAASDAVDQMDRMREAVLAMDNMVNIALKAVADAQSTANEKLDKLIGDLDSNHKAINDHLVQVNKVAQEAADKMIVEAVHASVVDAKIEVRQVEIPTWAEAPTDASRRDVVKARQRMSDVVGKRAATFQSAVDVMNAQAAAKKAREESQG